MTRMGTGPWIVRLSRLQWGEMSDEHKEAFSEWLKTAAGHDLYILLRAVRTDQNRISSGSIRAQVTKAVLDNEDEE